MADEAGPISIKTYTGPTSTDDAKNHMLSLMSQGKNASVTGDETGQTVIVRPGKLSQAQQTQARKTLLQRNIDDPSIRKRADANATFTPPPEEPILPKKSGGAVKKKKKASSSYMGGGKVYRGRSYARGGRVAKYNG